MESVKMKKATKTVAFRQLAIYCNIVDNQLLTDAEVLKDVGQDLVGSHFASNVAEVKDALAQVLAHEVAREAQLEAFLHAMNGVEGAAEGFVVAHVSDDDVVLADFG